jgi:hypothetical protein
VPNKIKVNSPAIALNNSKLAKMKRPHIVPKGGSFENESDNSPSKTEPDNYDVEEVVEKMLARKDRKIPGSVYKSHSETVQLIQSCSLG